MLISVAIPCYCSERNLRSVVTEIRDEFALHLEHDYQIILVCDGSPDGTDELIKELCAEDKKITGVLLSRNFSQFNAKIAAVPFVRGDMLVFVDDDGQHQPKDIFRMAEKIAEGCDVVYAKFSVKQQNWFKVWSSNLYENALEKFEIRPKGIVTSSFCACSRLAIEQLKNYKNPSPSISGYFYSFTTRFVNIDSEQRKRLSGHSGYSLKKRINLALVSLTNFTIAPLRIIDAVGAFFAITGLIYGLILIIKRLLLKHAIFGYEYSLNIVLMLILGGFILIALGMLGEYVGRIYILLSNKPQYVVRELINPPVTERFQGMDAFD